MGFCPFQQCRDRPPAMPEEAWRRAGRHSSTGMSTTGNGTQDIFWDDPSVVSTARPTRCRSTRAPARGMRPVARQHSSTSGRCRPGAGFRHFFATPSRTRRHAGRFVEVHPDLCIHHTRPGFRRPPPRPAGPEINLEEADFDWGTAELMGLANRLLQRQGGEPSERAATICAGCPAQVGAQSDDCCEVTMGRKPPTTTSRR